MNLARKPKLIAIVGQTATGKTALAIKLAKKINGEIISADSRQLYKGLRLLSGQPTKKEMSDIPHHLLGTENPKRIFSVALYQKKAYKIIDDIIARGKVPILVGGTGLYIDAIVKGTVLPDVPPNPRLRQKLQNKSNSELFSILQKLDPRRANEIDHHNPVRLLRAIEIAQAIGKVPEEKYEPRYNVLSVGVTIPEKILSAKIKKRISERLQKGMLREGARLHKNGLSYKRLEALGLECRFTSLFLQKKITRSEFEKELFTATLQYAKRQKTWFKKGTTIWIPPKTSVLLPMVLNFLFKNLSVF